MFHEILFCATRSAQQDDGSVKRQVRRKMRLWLCSRWIFSVLHMFVCGVTVQVR